MSKNFFKKLNLKINLLIIDIYILFFLLVYNIKIKFKQYLSGLFFKNFRKVVLTFLLIFLNLIIIFLFFDIEEFFINLGLIIQIFCIYFDLNLNILKVTFSLLFIMFGIKNLIKKRLYRKLFYFFLFKIFILLIFIQTGYFMSTLNIFYKQVFSEFYTLLSSLNFIPIISCEKDMNTQGLCLMLGTLGVSTLGLFFIGKGCYSQYQEIQKLKSVLRIENQFNFNLKIEKTQKEEIHQILVDILSKKFEKVESLNGLNNILNENLINLESYNNSEFYKLSNLEDREAVSKKAADYLLLKLSDRNYHLKGMHTFINQTEIDLQYIKEKTKCKLIESRNLPGTYEVMLNGITDEIHLEIDTNVIRENSIKDLQIINNLQDKEILKIKNYYKSREIQISLENINSKEVIVTIPDIQSKNIGIVLDTSNNVKLYPIKAEFCKLYTTDNITIRDIRLFENMDVTFHFFKDLSGSYVSSFSVLEELPIFFIEFLGFDFSMFEIVQLCNKYNNVDIYNIISPDYKNYIESGNRSWLLIEDSKEDSKTSEK